MDEQLIAAIESRNLERVQELLAAGANPNAKKGNETAYELAKYNADEIKCALIEAGANDPELKHSLVWAVRTNRIETVRTLIEKGADVNMASIGAGSPLESAASGGNGEIVDLLIAAGADVNDGSMRHTPLLNAIEREHFEVALKLIAAGANPTYTTKFGGSVPPIGMAAARGSAEVVRALIEAGAEVNAEVRHITINRTLIQKQAGAALQSVFELLETTGKAMEKFDDEETTLSDIDETVESVDLAANRAQLSGSQMAQPENAADTYPVILAARCGHADVLQILLEAGADPYRKDGEGLAACDWAIRHEYPHILEVLRRFDADTPKVSPEEYLLDAAEQGDVSAVEEWLEKGAAVDTRDVRRQTRNYTPLMLAAAQGHPEVARVLLDAGADANVRDRVDSNQKQPNGMILDHCSYDTLKEMGFVLGLTPLMLAAMQGHVSVVELLIARQTDVNARDCLGKDALCLACSNGHLPVVRALVNAGVSINQQDSQGDTPLLLALSHQHIPLATFLVESGADVNAKNEEKRTPLMAAIHEEEYLEIIQTLVERGADVNAVSEDGDTVMTLADLFEHHRIVKFLVKQGAEKQCWDERDDDDENEDEEDRWGSEIPQPDFSQAAQNPEYQKAVADLGEICGSRPVAMYDDIPGWFQVHVNSARREGIKTEELQQQFLERGCFIYEPDNYFDSEGPKKLNILPTTDKYDAIALHQTNGCDDSVGPGYIVEWLQELEAQQPFVLTLVAHDTLNGRFLTPIQDPEGLAKQMYNLCSDLVDQGCGSVERLADSLREGDRLYFWWD
ncbi:ankyrin repeat domain-containing protein [Lusitaniella coriacea]|uniref:ankyrin repeat domain-containing protein n=1 Tax=Lusitaniella coriacea TaxID=1983105 RepID=UPI003CF6CD1F